MSNMIRSGHRKSRGRNLNDLSGRRKSRMRNLHHLIGRQNVPIRPSWRHRISQSRRSQRRKSQSRNLHDLSGRLKVPIHSSWRRKSRGASRSSAAKQSRKGGFLIVRPTAYVFGSLRRCSGRPHGRQKSRQCSWQHTSLLHTSLLRQSRKQKALCAGANKPSGRSGVGKKRKHGSRYAHYDDEERSDESGAQDKYHDGERPSSKLRRRSADRKNRDTQRGAKRHADRDADAYRGRDQKQQDGKQRKPDSEAEESSVWQKIKQHWHDHKSKYLLGAAAIGALALANSGIWSSSSSTHAKEAANSQNEAKEAEQQVAALQRDPLATEEEKNAAKKKVSLLLATAAETRQNAIDSLHTNIANYCQDFTAFATSIHYKTTEDKKSIVYNNKTFEIQITKQANTPYSYTIKYENGTQLDLTVFDIVNGAHDSALNAALAFKMLDEGDVDTVNNLRYQLTNILRDAKTLTYVLDVNTLCNV